MKRHAPKFGTCENCGRKTMLTWCRIDEEKGHQYVCRICLLPEEVLKVEDYIQQRGALADAEVWAHGNIGSEDSKKTRAISTAPRTKRKNNKNNDRG